ncbi:MAG: hypothetical protein QM820_47405 [Minicystis sp.]
MSSLSPVRSFPRLALLLGVGAATLAAACGGKTIVETGPAGGSGGATTTGLGGAGGLSNDCDVLGADFQSKLAAAQSCDPLINAIQCSGTATLHDGCGCEVAGNELAPEKVSLAVDAFEAWVNAGCGPFECALCPPPPSSVSWFCDPGSSQCKPASF